MSVPTCSCRPEQQPFNDDLLRECPHGRLWIPERGAWLEVEWARA